ncbi:MAG TPA: ATP-binding protein [Noviherbaspirillum sp.]|uniref:ATP-binding protein n=1 Tax=Noviherbaspirillum sp. TaxID=1926288 RepID=UPI002D43966E|nr:ATP-binding protein [Noviherbaspirillum sp.]HYD95063.1 ATP-binding protein [Noviherbaspirillum sp.]
MNRIFFRIVPLILLAIAVAVAAAYFAIRYLFGDPLEDIARKQASGAIFLLEQYIDQAPADEWLARLNKVREVSGLSMEIVPLQLAAAALDGDRRAALDRGEIVLDTGSKLLRRRVDLRGERYIGSDAEVIEVRNLPIDVGLELKMDALRYAIVALCVLIPVALWSRSHWRELQSLSRVAESLGAGNLSVRAETGERSGIHPLALCMNRMAERIEGLLGAHRNLLHSVSHELRTPISRIEFGLELLRDVESRDELEKRLGRMESDVRELNDLVSELLNLARIDQQRAAAQASIALDGLLRESLGKLEHALGGKRVEMDVAQDAGSIVGDRNLLLRALNNMIANAAKYADSRIRLVAQRIPDGYVEILVEDDGPGIPADERERVFDPFYRLDRSRDRNTGGFGLGLAIAQKAVGLHGGEISAEESPLGGARFVTRIPC